MKISEGTDWKFKHCFLVWYFVSDVSGWSGMPVFQQNHICFQTNYCLKESNHHQHPQKKRILAIALSSRLLTLKTLCFLFALCHALSLSNQQECLGVKKIVSKWSCKYRLLISGNYMAKPHTKNSLWLYCNVLLSNVWEFWQKKTPLIQLWLDMGADVLSNFWHK
jgi:hypothetical protein